VRTGLRLPVLSERRLITSPGGSGPCPAEALTIKSVLSSGHEVSWADAGRSIGGECALPVTPLPFGRRLIVVSCHRVSLPEEGGLKHWPDLLMSPVLAENVGRTHVTCDVAGSDDLGGCGLSDVVARQRVVSLVQSRTEFGTAVNDRLVVSRHAGQYGAVTLYAPVPTGRWSVARRRLVVDRSVPDYHVKCAIKSREIDRLFFWTRARPATM